MASMIPALKMRSSRLLARSVRSSWASARNRHSSATSLQLVPSTGLTASVQDKRICPSSVPCRWLSTSSANEEDSKKEEESSKTEPLQNTNQESLQFQAETKQLLDIVTNSLYTDKEVVCSAINVHCICCCYFLSTH